MAKAGDDAGKTQGGGEFPPTQWSRVIRAGQHGSPQAEKALAELCEAYWFPLYAFLRRRGHPREDAEDLTQGFFEHLLQNDGLCRVKREGGKFRSFLRKALQNFLVNEWKRNNAKKRGGGKTLIPIDDTTEARYQKIELVDNVTPETLYERKWALTILDRARERLRKDYAAAGKQERFERFCDSLPGARREFSIPEVASALKMTEEAVPMAVSRFQRRFGKAVRAEIADTVEGGPEAIDDELRHLIKVIGNL